MSDTTLRTLVKSDMPAVIDLLRSISPYVPPYEIYDECWVDFSRQDNVISLVVEERGLAIGYGVVMIEQKIRGGKVGHIEDIVTHPQHRRKGLGRELVETLAQQAFSLGCYKVALHCQPHNVAFYEKCGFLDSGNSMQRFPTAS